MSQRDVLIGLEAEDNASLKIDTATKRINKSFKSMKDEQRAVTRQFELQNQTLVASQRVINVFSQGVNRALTLYNTWNLLSIRVQDSNRNVRDSLRDLNEAYVEFGPDSKQFQDALQNYRDALEDQKNTQRDVMIGYGLMITSIIADTARLTTTALPRLRVFAATLRGLRTPTPPAATAPSPAFPNAGAAAKTTPKTTPKGNFLTRNAGKLVRFGGPAAAAVSLVSLAGEQTAGETDIPMGADAIGDIANDVTQKIYNFTINTNDPNSVASKVLGAIKNFD